MRTEEQTSKHLLLAVIVTVASVMLILVTALMAWELWMIPLILAGSFGVWFLHIARVGSGAFYENLCAGLLLSEFFFFGVHRASLFEMPALACIMVLTLFMMNKSWMLYMIVALYILELLYHFLILHTITYDMGSWDAFRLLFGLIITLGGAALGRYWIGRRNAQRAWYES